MALDKEFFDAVSIEVVKKKYYNAGKVNALLENIRTQAEALTAENLRLKEELRALDGGKEEILTVLLSAQSQARQLLAKARQEADDIVRAARDRAGEDNMDVQERAVKCVERCFDSLKRQQQENIDDLNRQWQDFLCGLIPEEDHDSAPPAPEPGVMNELESKVDAIARELREITGK